MTNAARTLVLALAAFGLLLFLIDPNNDLVGGGDLYHIKHSALFASALTWGGEDLASATAVFAKLAQAAYGIFFYPHGPLPPAYFGVIYKLYDLIGLTVTPVLLYLPTAGLAAATVMLTARAVRHAGMGMPAMAAAGLFVILSPVFLASARGGGTYWVVAIAFNQALLAHAMLRHRVGGSAAWPLGLALAHALLSDILAFLVIGALVAADAAARSVREAAALLRRRGILVSVAVAAAIPIAGYVAYVLLRDKVTVPLYPILPFWGLVAHGGQLGEPISVNGVLTRLVLLLGDAWPPALALVAAGLVAGWRRDDPGRRFLRVFAAICLGGFGILFYGLSSDSPAGRYYYQIYLLVPAAMLAAFTVDSGWRAGRRVAVLAVLGVVLAGSATAAVTLVWRQPLSPFADRLMVTEDNDPAGDAIGIRRPDYGHRAAGYLVRSLLREVWTERPDAEARVYFGSTVAWKYLETFTNYAGLYQRGDWFTELLGRVPAFRLDALSRSTGWSAFKCPDGAQYCLAHNDGTTDQWTASPLPDGPPLACGAQFCVRLDVGGSGGAVAWQRYRVRDSDTDVVRYEILLRGHDSTVLRAGDYDRIDLERRFTRDYGRLEDYFPQRANDRVIALLQRLIGP